jgi:hypothetical protein
MPISEEEFASIKTMIDAAVGEIGQTFITGEVIKRDEANKLVWIKELGDQPIPVVDFQRTVDVYSLSANQNNDMRSARGYGIFTYSAGDAAHRTYAPALTTDFNTMGGSPFVSGRFNAPETGKYMLIYTVEQFTMAAASYMAVALLKNNTALLRSLNQATSPSSDANPYKGGVQTFFLGQLNAGDFVYLQSWCHQGGSAYLVIEAILLNAPLPQIQKRSEISRIIVPALGDTVVVALERGTRRLPRCLGVIQSTGYITAGDD